MPPIRATPLRSRMALFVRGAARSTGQVDLSLYEQELIQARSFEEMGQVRLGAEVGLLGVS